LVLSARQSTDFVDLVCPCAKIVHQGRDKGLRIVQQKLAVYHAASPS